MQKRLLNLLYQKQLKMIYINKNSSNRVTLTLNEKRTLANPYYIFVFINTQSKVETVFYMENLSVNKDRYDLFTLVEGTTVTLNEGEYTYTVYESETISLISSNWTGVVEIGRVIVKDDTATTHSFTPTDDTTISVFTPTN